MAFLRNFSHLIHQNVPRYYSCGSITMINNLFLPSSNQKLDEINKKTSDQKQKVELLINNGLIHLMSSGHYALLPMMRFAFDKLVSIVDKEMHNIGAQKLLLPNMYSIKYLQISERFEHFQKEVFMLNDKSGNELYLAPTHEEAITSILASCNPLGKKRLPLLLYQIDTKFRDELRPKFGMMRTKEFVMKDLYTFHNDEQCAFDTYDQVCQAYRNIFSKFDLPVYQAQASTGAMGGKHSHEFTVINDNGEDNMWICDSCGVCLNEEMLEDKNKASCKACNKQMQRHKVVEVGHTFYLADRYSSKFKANFNAGANCSPYLMGCYGLGITRILAVLLDKCSQNNQIRWPLALAPFHLSIILPKTGSKEDVQLSSILLAQQLAGQIKQQLNLNVLIDDRMDKSIGWKLKQNQSIGVPYSIVLGKNLLQSIPMFEFNDNYNSTSNIITHSELLSQLHSLFEQKTN